MQVDKSDELVLLKTFSMLVRGKAAKLLITK